MEKYYYVDAERVIRLLLKATGLDVIAQNEPVRLPVTSDAASTFHNRTQISIGIKVTDSLALHCKTKAPDFVPALEYDAGDQTGYFKGIQSSEMCSMCIMADARDKSQMYAEVFSEFYKNNAQLQMHGMPESEYGPTLHPMVVSYPSDLKAIWTTSGRGGNCKKTIFSVTSVLLQDMNW
jgi:hypothetical protein